MSDKKYILTPVGELDWPYLTKIDEKYGVYQTRIIFEDSDDFRAFQQKLMVSMEEEYNNALKALVGKPNAKRPKKADLFEELADGRFSMRAKMNAVVTPNGKPSFTQAPRIFDVNNKPWDLSVAIYTGSTARLYVELVPYTNALKGVGLSYRLKDVQIHKHVGRGAGGDSSPFGPVATREAPSAAPAFADGGGNSDDGDF